MLVVAIVSAAVSPFLICVEEESTDCKGRQYSTLDVDLVEGSVEGEEEGKEDEGKEDQRSVYGGEDSSGREGSRSRWLKDCRIMSVGGIVSAFC